MHTEPKPHDDADDLEAYEVAPEPEAAPAAARTSPAGSGKTLLGDDDDSIDAYPAEVSAARGKAAGDDGDDGDDGDTDDGDDSLPPAISRPAAPMPWLVAGGVCVALVAISWLAGAEQLTLPVDGKYEELGFGARVAGLGRTLVYAPIATLGAVFGILGLAFFRQRPVGDVAAMFAKCFAIVAIPMVLWLVPTEVRFLKQLLNFAGYPLAAGALAIPLFRIPLADAALATGLSLIGMTLVVLSAAVVVWAVGV
ncbi:MAG: hypothetical protein ACKOYN_05780 [Planctomycetota bacterium]